eukprot:4277321-Amphidinium_carterae.1
MPSRFAESLQVTRYEKGGKYDLHYDFSQIGRGESDPQRYPKGDVERAATVLVYLSDNFEGGETVFPRVAAPGSPGNSVLKYVPRAQDAIWSMNTDLTDYCSEESDVLKLKPQKGGGIVFFGYTPDGHRDMDTVHGSCPVKSGVKLVTQQWVNLNAGYASQYTLEDRRKRLSSGMGSCEVTGACARRQEIGASMRDLRDGAFPRVQGAETTTSTCPNCVFDIYRCDHFPEKHSNNKLFEAKMPRE